jgi:deazaflavin-dependent oxidoreductase (nitroreductase family)
MPHDLVLKTMNGAHRLLVKVTGGRLGYDAMGMPVLELTTTGRKSGQPRSVMLTAPLTENGRLVIVASRGGDDIHPAWFLNLRADPKVEVSVKGGPKEPMTARIASPEERTRMWPQIADKYSNYAGYQKKTDREIPLVILDPPS